MSEYLFKMLSNFSKTIEDKVSEYEKELGSHIRLLNLKLNDMEAKLSMIENKANRISATFEEILLKSDLNMKNITDLNSKIEKIIQDINSKVKMFNQSLKNQESNTLYQAKTLETSIIHQYENSKITNNLLIATKESSELNTDILYQKKIERIEQSLSSIDLLSNSSSVLRLESKYLKVKGELNQLKLDISKMIELILDND